MPKFEYHTLVTHPRAIGELDAEDNAMQALGAQGWELVGVSSVPLAFTPEQGADGGTRQCSVFYFKRTVATPLANSTASARITGEHQQCPDPTNCVCECRACKDAWYDAGRPQCEGGYTQRRDVHLDSPPVGG